MQGNIWVGLAYEVLPNLCCRSGPFSKPSRQRKGGKPAQQHAVDPSRASVRTAPGQARSPQGRATREVFRGGRPIASSGASGDGLGWKAALCAGRSSTGARAVGWAGWKTRDAPEFDGPAPAASVGLPPTI